MSARILIVEDDLELARGLAFNLEHAGYQVVHAANAAAANAAFDDDSIALVLLDLALPDGDGLELLAAWNQRGAARPAVICLTARGQEADIVMGLRRGADDYVTKPFGLSELLARTQAVLRRTTGEPRTVAAGSDPRAPGTTVVDLAAHRVIHGQREVSLTPIEVEILEYFLARRGIALERTQILADLWGLDRRATTRTLDNHIARLRKKLEPDPAAPRWLVTVHGIGYRLSQDDASTSIQVRDRPVEGRGRP